MKKPNFKIRAWDKYHEQWIIISFPEDEVFYNCSSNEGCFYNNVEMEVVAEEGDKDSCDLKRFSDLEQITVIQ